MRRLSLHLLRQARRRPSNATPDSLCNRYIQRPNFSNCARRKTFQPACEAVTAHFHPVQPSPSTYFPEDPAIMPKDKDKKLTFQLKTPKGTKDWAGGDVLLRDRIFSTITS